ncbi:MAG: hypothetical protein QM537_06525, partial [Candidatus Symbiobacter sp.]|nr:hypothetical protein [Candidatus Symbiobacter sp.]
MRQKNKSVITRLKRERQKGSVITRLKRERQKKERHYPPKYPWNTDISSRVIPQEDYSQNSWGITRLALFVPRIRRRVMTLPFLTLFGYVAGIKRKSVITRRFLPQSGINLSGNPPGGLF